MTRLNALMKAVVASALVSAVAGGMVQGRRRHSNDLNVCMQGHFAPEVYLLGAPKCGTTSFFEDFVRSSAVQNYQPNEGEDAWHVKEPWMFAPNESDLDEKDYWLSHYPACQQGTRGVAIDGTPGYFSCATAPKTIQTFYSGSGHMNDLKFMVFLRNPVTRAHSHFYHYVENGVRNGSFGETCPPDVFPATFEKAVQNVLANGEMCNGCGCNDVFEDSMYAASFENWFQYFDASQFLIAPFEAAVKPELVTFVWDMLTMPYGTGTKTPLASSESGGEMNHHDYPTLDQDLTRATRTDFDTYIEEKTGPGVVANMLVNTKAILYSYEGDVGNTTAIATWLSDNWGA